MDGIIRFSKGYNSITYNTRNFRGVVVIDKRKVQENPSMDGG